MAESVSASYCRRKSFTHISAHGIDTVVLGTIDIVLVTEHADGHACNQSAYSPPYTVTYLLTRARDVGQLDGSRETLVTLRVIVLEADLELDGLEEVPLLGLVGVLEELLDVGADTGDRDFRHIDCVSPRGYSVPLVALVRWWLKRKEAESRVAAIS